MTSAEITVNILVVDDLPEKLLAMELILQQPGLNVVQARSGREALRRLLEQDFAVILLDINMPDMDGFETALLIRQRRRSEHTPIIFVTAFTDEMHAARGYSLGAVDYILSPVIPEVLRTKVGVFVDLYRKNEQVKRQAEQQVVLALEQAARAVAEEATQRSQFLAEASTRLMRSLDFEAIIRELLQLVVPRLADLAAVTMADGHSHPSRTEIAQTHSSEGIIYRSILHSTDRPASALLAALKRVLSSGKPEVLDDLNANHPFEDKSTLVLPETNHLLRTAAIFPLLARGRSLGALTLGQRDPGRFLSTADLAMAEDLASRAAMALDNARLYRDIQEADQHKNEFLAMLAHELRNPLAPVRNAARLLQMPETGTHEQRLASEVIERQVKQMVRLVDDLLDVSRITRGKITLRPEKINVADIVTMAVETVRSLIAERGHELIVSLPPESIQIEADPARLAQVLANLMNNAAKYTGVKGRIELIVELVKNEIVFRVRDNGQGIPPEMLSSIFNLFTQVDRSLDRSQGGLGIGLTLVRRLVELHGGRVEAHSQGQDAGSEFVVYIPAYSQEIAESETPNGQHSEEEDKYVEQERHCDIRVLIVDDNVDGAESLAVLLQALGYDVRTAHDGPSAIITASTYCPDAILLDIGLPRMDGYEVARRLRVMPGLVNLLLIALTGYGQEQDRLRAFEAGFDHHLVKPVAVEVLEGLLSRATTSKKMNESKQMTEKLAGQTT